LFGKARLRFGRATAAATAADFFRAYCSFRARLN
jgi:hypothetical protein